MIDLTNLMNLYDVTTRVRTRAMSTLDGRASEPEQYALAYAGRSLSFGEMVLNQCRTTTGNTGLTDDWAALFLAQGELFLAAIATELGISKKPKGEINPVDVYLFRCVCEPMQHISMVDIGDPQRLTRVMFGHTCAIGDWVGLLADLGRGYRMANTLGIDMEVLAAGVSWMCANRSVFTATNLSQREVEQCLIVNEHKRNTLYRALGIRSNILPVPAYPQGSDLNRTVLEEMAKHYAELARIVFGVQGGKITKSEIALFDPARLTAADSELPEPILRLRNAGLLGVDSSNSINDVTILCKIARIFLTLDPEIFIYFFAQWFAQREYRKDALKVAAYSEIPFDSMFVDAHYDYVQTRWGGGNNDTDFARLAAAYHPHYCVGKIGALPYNPFSLSNLEKPVGDWQQVFEQMIPVEGPLEAGFICSRLRETGCYELNCLMADLASFLLLCQRMVPGAVALACSEFQLKDASELFTKLGAGPCWAIETRLESGSEVRNTMLSWLESAVYADGQNRYVPLHMWFLLHLQWSESEYEQLTTMVMIVRRLYQLLTEVNWMSRIHSRSDQQE